MSPQWDWKPRLTVGPLLPAEGGAALLPEAPSSEASKAPLLQPPGPPPSDIQSDSRPR